MTDRDQNAARPHWADARAVLRATLVVLAVLGGLWLVYALRTIILLVVFSILVAYVIAPLVALLRRPFTLGGRRRELPIGVSIALVYLFILGAVGWSVAWLLPNLGDQVTRFAAEAPARSRSVIASAQSLSNTFGLERLPGPSAVLVQRALSAATSAIDAGTQRIVTALVRLATYVPWLVVIPVIAFFLLKDAAALKREALCLLPPGRWRAHGAAFLDRMNVALAAFVLAQLLACLIVAVIVGIGFTLLHVPYAGVLAVAAGVAELVPLLGPLAIAFVSAIVAAQIAPMLAFWVLLFLAVFRIVEDYAIYPRLIGRKIDLHPLAVIIAVLSGAELGGAVGVLLSVPVLAVLFAGYRYVAETTGVFRGSH